MKKDVELWGYERLEDRLGPPEDFRENFQSWEFPEIPIGRDTIYGWRVFGYDPQEPRKLKIGFGCDVAYANAIFAHYGITIEPYVQIGPHCAIMSSSTIDSKQGPVALERNCRIGSHSTIMPGVTIGENSIVGAHTLVVKDVPPNVIFYRRFTKEITKPIEHDR